MLTTEVARPKVLVVDDEPTFRVFLEESLREAGYEPLGAASGAEALPLLGRGKFALVLTDLRMPKMDGITLIRFVREVDPDVPIIMMSAHGTVDDALQAIRDGANDYITKPFVSAEFLFRMRMVLRSAQQTREIERLSAELAGTQDFEGMVGRAKAMLAVFDRVRSVAGTDATVLVTGETGTGKELIAQSIHRLSGRKGKPFVAVNCGAIPETLFESELFGYERGAFTGASDRRVGKVEAASGGTLLLDEVGDLPLSAQVKLLRTIQSRTVERLGSNKPIPVDVRLLAATSRDLQRLVESGAFREDLFYRLNVVEIRVPPLRERTEDIPVLVNHMVHRFAAAYARPATRVAPAVLDRLVSYGWPGNVRQLEHVIERAVVLCKGTTVEEVELPAAASARPDGGERRVDVSVPLKDLVEHEVTRIEKDYLVQILDECNGRIGAAADRAGLNRKSFYSKMKQYGLRKEDFKE